MKRFLVTLLMMPALSAWSFAAEIRILSAGAVETGLQAFAPCGPLHFQTQQLGYPT